MGTHSVLNHTPMFSAFDCRDLSIWGYDETQKFRGPAEHLMVATPLIPKILVLAKKCKSKSL